MMNNVVNVGKVYLLLGIAVIFFAACSNDKEDEPLVDQELTQTELRTILEIDDVSGTADTVISELFSNAGATSKSAKTEDECYTAQYTDTGFTATFANCVLNGTDNVNGTLVVTYMAGEESNAFTATYTDFYVGSIKLNGTRTYTINSDAQASSISFAVTTDMTVVMEDGTSLVEKGTKTTGFTFDGETEELLFTLSGSWTLAVDGDTYTVNVVSPLEIGLDCAYFGKGSMDVAKNGLEVNVDFGDGTCDDVAILTYPDETTQEISLRD